MIDSSPSKGSVLHAESSAPPANSTPVEGAPAPWVSPRTFRIGQTSSGAQSYPMMQIAQFIKLGKVFRKCVLEGRSVVLHDFVYLLANRTYLWHCTQFMVSFT